MASLHREGKKPHHGRLALCVARSCTNIYVTIQRTDVPLINSFISCKRQEAIGGNTRRQSARRVHSRPAYQNEHTRHAPRAISVPGFQALEHAPCHVPVHGSCESCMHAQQPRFTQSKIHRVGRYVTRKKRTHPLHCLGSPSPSPWLCIRAPTMVGASLVR